MFTAMTMCMRRAKGTRIAQLCMLTEWQAQSLKGSNKRNQAW